MTDRAANEKWSARDVRELTEALRVITEIEKEFQRRKVAVISQALRTTIGSCSKCGRPLIPRRLWDLIPPEVRTGIVARKHDTQTCFSHYIRRYRAGARKRMEADRLARLRILAGYDPTKDYDAMEDSA